MIDSIRAFLMDISSTQQEFYPSELHRLAYQRRAKLSGITFRYGAVRPYSEELDDILSVLLINGDLELNSSDPCKVVISQPLRGHATHIAK